MIKIINIKWLIWISDVRPFIQQQGDCSAFLILITYSWEASRSFNFTFKSSSYNFTLRNCVCMWVMVCTVFSPLYLSRLALGVLFLDLINYYNSFLLLKLSICIYMFLIFHKPNSNNKSNSPNDRYFLIYSETWINQACILTFLVKIVSNS